MLIINKDNKEWTYNKDKIMNEEIRKLEDKFDGIEFSHVLHAKNEEANILAKIGSSRFLCLKGSS